jgi:hypothetical protein
MPCDVPLGANIECADWKFACDFLMKNHSPDCPDSWHSISFLLQDLEVHLTGLTSPIPQVFLASIESCKNLENLSQNSCLSIAVYILTQSVMAPIFCLLGGGSVNSRTVLHHLQVTGPSLMVQEEVDLIYVANMHHLVFLSQLFPLCPWVLIPWYDPVTVTCFLNTFLWIQKTWYFGFFWNIP